MREFTVSILPILQTIFNIPLFAPTVYLLSIFVEN